MTCSYCRWGILQFLLRISASVRSGKRTRAGWETWNNRSFMLSWNWGIRSCRYVFCILLMLIDLFINNFLCILYQFQWNSSIGEDELQRFLPQKKNNDLFEVRRYVGVKFQNSAFTRNQFFRFEAAIFRPPGTVPKNHWRFCMFI